MTTDIPLDLHVDDLDLAVEELPDGNAPSALSTLACFPCLCSLSSACPS